MIRNDAKFNEALPPRKLDPLDGRSSTPFPYEEIMLAIDGAKAELSPHDWEAMASALKVIMRDILRPASGGCTQSSAKWRKAVFGRLVALLWSIDPAYFNGNPSLRTLAKRLHIFDNTLARNVVRTRRKYGVANRNQHAHAWNYQQHKAGVKHYR